jgi:hypothetical protein
VLIPQSFLIVSLIMFKGLNDKPDSLRRELHWLLPLLGGTRPQHRTILDSQEPLTSYAHWSSDPDKMWVHRRQQRYVRGKRHVHIWFPTVMVAIVIHNVKGVGIDVALREPPPVLSEGWPREC